jgi:ketosteroid isomerase-like protein
VSAGDVEIVREMLERFNRQDYEGSTAMLHDDIEMRQWGALPDTDTYLGKGAFIRGLTRWLSGFEPGFRYVPEELIDRGGSVLARVTLLGKGRSSGIPMEQEVFQLYEVRDGKIWRVSVFSTEEEARKAAGLES